MLRLRSLSLLILFGAAACGSDVDDRPATWSFIHPALIVPNCATSGCHSSLTRTAGFDFEDPEKALVSWQGDGAPDVPLLEGTRVGGVRMPKDMPLPQADIDLIGRWINAGRLDN